jgi:hypothetical protein
MMHVVLTLDALLVETRWAEAVLMDRWKDRVARKLHQLPRNPAKRTRRIRRFFRTVGIVELTALPTAEKWLADQGLIA